VPRLRGLRTATQRWVESTCYKIRQGAGEVGEGERERRDELASRYEGYGMLATCDRRGGFDILRMKSM
jgi:hypothetical protein